MAKKKTWREKLFHSKDLPKVVLLGKNAKKHWKGNTMAIPSPIEVNQMMARIPKGKLITMEEIRRRIAKKHKADIGCPLTWGIFSWLSAHAAHLCEEYRNFGRIKAPTKRRALPLLFGNHPLSRPKLVELEVHHIEPIPAH